jgi:uncharacterized protein YndB with AHSA1/START domain
MTTSASGPRILETEVVSAHTAETGTLRLSVGVPVSVQKAYAALTERSIVSEWFGELSATLDASGTYRLDFGDGDFFEITDVELAPPAGLSYRWRFLGTGPANAICWRLEPSQSGCCVTVIDRGDNRDNQTIKELSEGWTDFLQRLQAFCATGMNARYDWRHEFDGSIELSIGADAAFKELFSESACSSWLPWRSAVPPFLVRVADGTQPERFNIYAVRCGDDTKMHICVGCSEWRTSTECTIQVRDRGGGSLLLISHKGWEEISLREFDQALQRRRFSKLWTEALSAAQIIVEG